MEKQIIEIKTSNNRIDYIVEITPSISNLKPTAEVFTESEHRLKNLPDHKRIIRYVDRDILSRFKNVASDIDALELAIKRCKGENEELDIKVLEKNIRILQTIQALSDEYTEILH
ncbi:hypothetical protein [Sunxiuqinia indica]|uniref:hypothetical protein n=1 Tax=Sunxiuqinia indica TaxID=2692584 RepID=UPI00135C481C|nr:hypothetical protein [Sunxiuqinia indica]